MGAIIQLNTIYLQSATCANDVVLNILKPILNNWLTDYPELCHCLSTIIVCFLWKRKTYV